MNKNLQLNLNDKKAQLIAKALSSKTRIKILDLLASRKSLNIQEIAKLLNMPMSSTTVNVQILEEADLLITIYQPGIRGSMKLCSIKHENINFVLFNQENNNNEKSYIIDMPIGQYYDCDIKPTCGLVSENEYLSKDDDETAFYHPERYKAQLLWFYLGFVEYRLPMPDININKIISINISLEVCSEAPNFRLDWPSDITVWINNQEINTWTSPGDLGGRRGNFTPLWWSINSTQYGLLKSWEINNFGSYLDGEKVSKINLKNILNKNKRFLSFKIGFKKGAKNLGGINIFGEKFGDYNQNIIMKINYEL